MWLNSQIPQAQKNKVQAKKIKKSDSSLWETDPTSLFSNKFIASIISFMSSSIQHGVYFVNLGPTESKMDDKQGVF